MRSHSADFGLHQDIHTYLILSLMNEGLYFSPSARVSNLNPLYQSLMIFIAWLAPMYVCADASKLGCFLFDLSC